MTKKAGKEEWKREWKRKRKQEHLEQKKYRYYIFCEGEKTEPNYFNGFKEHIESNPIYEDLVLIDIQPCGAETMSVLSQAEEYVANNKLKKGHIWCIYDKDDFPDSRFNNVCARTRALNKRSKELQYHAAWSNQCIEFWFILHFSNYTSNNNREEYIKYLNKQFVQQKLSKYAKNMDDIFDILLKHGNPKLAIRYAKNIIADNPKKTPAMIAPGTKVYELVEELAKFLPEEEMKKFI